MQPGSSTVTPLLVDLASVDRTPYLALNNAHAVELSELTAAAFDAHVAGAFYAKGFGAPLGLLLAFDQDAGLASPNFRWFRERYGRFVYIDRIVIDAPGQGAGLARRLYEDLFALAAASGHDTITCEVNSDPPNPASDTFHAKLGFVVVGSAVLADRGKSVRYLCRRLPNS